MAMSDSVAESHSYGYVPDSSCYVAAVPKYVYKPHLVMNTKCASSALLNVRNNILQARKECPIDPGKTSAGEWRESSRNH